MKERIEEAFNLLKELDVRPTPKNVSILNGVYDLLKQAYKGLSEQETKTEPEENPEEK